MIHLLSSQATAEQLTEMLEELTDYVKLAVDIKREIVAGGGELHADCETVLLEDGSKQEDVWGADWWPLTKEVRYGSFINIRPGQNNPAMEIFWGHMNSDRAKLDARKERYLRDPLPVRLGNLASNLARIRSIATRPDLGEAARRVIRESKH